MRKLLAVCLLSCVIPVVAAGQSVSMSTGYTYLHTPTSNLNGWYFIPAVNFNDWLGALADFTNFYGTANGNNLAIHGFTFGPIVSWTNSTRITPVAFTELGLVRSNSAGNITDALGWVLGGGFEIKMTSHLSLQVVPGEYVLTHANGTNANNYTMKIGLTFPLKK